MNPCLYDAYGSYSCALNEHFTDVVGGAPSMPSVVNPSSGSVPSVVSGVVAPVGTVASLVNAANGVVASSNLAASVVGAAKLLDMKKVNSVNKCSDNHTNEWCRKCDTNERHRWCNAHSSDLPVQSKVNPTRVETFTTSKCQDNHSKKWCNEHQTHHNESFTNQQGHQTQQGRQRQQGHQNQRGREGFTNQVENFADIVPSTIPFQVCPPAPINVPYNIAYTIPAGQFNFPSGGSTAITMQSIGKPQSIGKTQLIILGASTTSKSLKCVDGNLSVLFVGGSGIDWCKVYFVVNRYATINKGVAYAQPSFNGGSNTSTYFITSNPPTTPDTAKRMIPYTFNAASLFPEFKISNTIDTFYIEVALVVEKSADDQCIINWSNIVFTL